MLDLCAAPGSKTAQIIEFLHGDKALGVKDEGLYLILFDMMVDESLIAVLFLILRSKSRFCDRE